MWFSVGIDLGTSFSSAAVGGPGGTRMVPLSPSMVVPSVACPGPNGSVLTGLDALQAATDPASLARGFKRRLGDPSRLVLGGASFSPAALMAAQLRDVLAAVNRHQGGVPTSIVLTCPAIWGPYRREHFAEVPMLAGVKSYRLVTEPEAAATHYSNERRLGEGEVVAVYDLGGGTFDTTILRVRGGRMEILGTPEGIEHMGGVDFDETLLANIDERLDGAITELDEEDPEHATALAKIRAMVVKAKEDLSIEPDVTLSVPLPSGPRELTISRLEFNDMIRPSVELTAETLQRTVTNAGLQPNDLSGILLAGGSSRIPLVPQLISKEFGRPVRVSLHPKFTVALGAASIAARMASEPPRASGTGPMPVPPAAQHAPAPGGAAPAGVPATAAFGQPANGAGEPKRRGTRIALVAAAVVAVVALVTTVVLLSRSPDGDNEAAGASGGTVSAGASTEAERVADETRAPLPSSAAAPGSAGADMKPGSAPSNSPGPLKVFDGAAVSPWAGFIGSLETNWSGTDLTNGTVRDGSLTARVDDQGVHASWNGSGPAQLYFQSSPDASKARDLSRYFSSDGAITFDVAVHKRPTKVTSLELHCVHPCRSTVSIDKVLKRLDTGKKTTVTIPLSCFTRKQEYDWNPKRVNTAWLVYTEGALSATFSDIRWEAEAGGSQDAVSCDDLL